MMQSVSTPLLPTMPALLSAKQAGRQTQCNEQPPFFCGLFCFVLFGVFVLLDRPSLQSYATKMDRDSNDDDNDNDNDNNNNSNHNLDSYSGSTNMQSFNNSNNNNTNTSSHT